MRTAWGIEVGAFAGMMEFVDTHCHLDLPQFAADLEAMLARATAVGVGQMVVPAIDLGNLKAVLHLAATHLPIYAAVGVHPNSTNEWQAGWLEVIRAAAAAPNVVAIGEIGLDYYWDKSPKARQQAALAAQLGLAAELDLPVILHNREATADLIPLLAESPLVGRARAGVLHSFSADWAAAAAALEMGFYLGFTGPVTFKKADELREIVRRTPLERILIETDAPYLAPQPHRGKRNEPAYVALVAEAIAAVKGVETAVIAHHTTANARHLFRLPSAS
jgi:TatD DNase family protein